MCLAIGSSKDQEEKLSLPAKVWRWLTFSVLLVRFFFSGLYHWALRAISPGRA